MICPNLQKTADFAMILQVATFLVAAVGPFLAYRFARELAVTGNQQAWLTALRTDLADLIAKTDRAAVISKSHEKATEADSKSDLADQGLQAHYEVQSIRFRLRLRLRKGLSEHDALIEATESFVKAHSKSSEERTAARNRLLEAAETILHDVSQRVER